MIIGSHVSFLDTQLLGSIEETLSYGGNALMFYTGAPQNTIRKNINLEYLEKAKQLMQANNLDLNNVICHAPYIVNLANNKEASKYDFSINFLKQELNRCQEMGIKYMVIHPGSSVGIDENIALDNIIYALNKIITSDTTTTILLETMAGKGTELGKTLKELKYILDGVLNKAKIGVCLDTCHLNDAGYNMANFDDFLNEFDKLIGLAKIKCVHLNDSKNELNSHKDRHANIGLGTIGFTNLLKIVNNHRLKDIPKILETPYIDTNEAKKRQYPPYKMEIAMLKKGEFNPNLIEDIKNYYEEKETT